MTDRELRTGDGGGRLMEYAAALRAPVGGLLFHPGVPTPVRYGIDLWIATVTQG